MTDFLDALKSTSNVAYTENGARAYATTNSKLLDFFSQGGALRDASKSKQVQMFSQAWSEDHDLALKAMFYFRDIRGGQGQRGAFRAQLEYLAKIAPSTVRKNLDKIAEYGRWDDLYALFEVENGFGSVDTELRAAVIDVFRAQLEKDIAAYESGDNVSLLAKWMKSENASSPDTKKLALQTRLGLGMSSAEYRKTLSKLRKHLDVVERKVSARKWDDIDYQRVPSNAMMKYRKSFFAHDEQRFKDFIDMVNTGEAKINSSVLYPYEIVGKVMRNQINAGLAQGMWDNLPDYIEGSEESSIAVVDTSGSMGMGDGKAKDVALSIGLYMAERARGAFKDHFITFSHKPKLQAVSGKTLVEKVSNMWRADWDGNTNIEAVFDLILKTAVDHKMNPDDVVKRLYIISDMEFDSCTGGGYYSSVSDVDQTLFQTLANRFKAAGYTMPALVFWNVNARNVQFPMKADERGFVNVSGFSPSIFKTLMTGESSTPYDLMLEVLNNDRYAPLEV